MAQWHQEESSSELHWVVGFLDREIRLHIHHFWQITQNNASKTVPNSAHTCETPKRTQWNSYVDFCMSGTPCAWKKPKQHGPDPVWPSQNFGRRYFGWVGIAVGQYGWRPGRSKDPLGQPGSGLKESLGPSPWVLSFVADWLGLVGVFRCLPTATGVADVNTGHALGR